MFFRALTRNHSFHIDRFRKKEDVVLAPGTGRESDIVIPIMGPTGVGKSTFINNVLGKHEADVSDGFRSCTKQLAHYFICPSPEQLEGKSKPAESKVEEELKLVGGLNLVGEGEREAKSAGQSEEESKLAGRSNLPAESKAGGDLEVVAKSKVGGESKPGGKANAAQVSQAQLKANPGGRAEGEPKLTRELEGESKLPGELKVMGELREEGESKPAGQSEEESKLEERSNLPAESKAGGDLEVVAESKVKEEASSAGKANAVQVSQAQPEAKPGGRAEGAPKLAGELKGESKLPGESDPKGESKVMGELREEGESKPAGQSEEESKLAGRSNLPAESKVGGDLEAVAESKVKEESSSAGGENVEKKVKPEGQLKVEGESKTGVKANAAQVSQAQPEAKPGGRAEGESKLPGELKVMGELREEGEPKPAGQSEGESKLAGQSNPPAESKVVTEAKPEGQPKVEEESKLRGESKLPGYTKVERGSESAKPAGEMKDFQIDLEGRRIVLVDTPGFDDTELPDSEILRRIAVWLASSYDSNMKVGGVIYMYPIYPNRMTRNDRSNIKVFRKICGEEGLSKVVLTTTRWDICPPESGEKRKKELKNTFWSDLLPESDSEEMTKAGMAELWNTPESAWNLIRYILKRRADCEIDGVILTIQDEIVERAQKLKHTDAAQELRQKLQDLLKESGMVASETRREKLRSIQAEVAALRLPLSTRMMRFLGLTS